jgi:hypothetical protein
MNLRIEGTLSELRQLYQSLSSRGFTLANCKIYANALPGEDRRGIKRKIPPFPPSQINDDLISIHKDREFRLYGDISVTSTQTPSPSPYDAVLGGDSANI